MAVSVQPTRAQRSRCRRTGILRLSADLTTTTPLAQSGVFTRTGGAWNQQGGKLVGNGGANDSFGLLQQGTSVAISADGNTIISGAPYDNNDMGAVWVFNRSNGVWSQQGMKLVGTGGSAESKQGTSVALSADGNMAIVGGTGDNSVWTFIRVNGTWSQRGSKLSESFDCFGSAAALSADGNTALVGSFCEGTVGAAWVFTQSGGGWIQDTKLVGSGAIGGCLRGACRRAFVRRQYGAGGWVFRRQFCWCCMGLHASERHLEPTGRQADTGRHDRRCASIWAVSGFVWRRRYRFGGRPRGQQFRRGHVDIHSNQRSVDRTIETFGQQRSGVRFCGGRVG